MTQKELLYLEDAIFHEKNLNSYLEYAVSNLKDCKLVEFVKKELKNHDIVESNLIAKLEDNTNE